jgi:hypothetical protein
MDPVPGIPTRTNPAILTVPAVLVSRTVMDGPVTPAGRVGDTSSPADTATDRRATTGGSAGRGHRTTIGRTGPVIGTATPPRTGRTATPAASTR